ncbi:putative ATP-dependent RNA helicase DDX27 [Planoprotostelium fungivorum]|uniref:Putative ATP-dependent RNA helicase DDX27 n=1 Tax=Planoprotostelium fungivorum TaxID=1890364 RepID=A0A2P6N1W0_9EUKA|nr:putative ATP-dependent RNA helicase DDX27 [Planoprotostelium fungivorum]
MRTCELASLLVYGLCGNPYYCFRATEKSLSRRITNLMLAFHFSVRPIVHPHIPIQPSGQHLEDEETALARAELEHERYRESIRRKKAPKPLGCLHIPSESEEEEDGEEDGVEELQEEEEEEEIEEGSVDMDDGREDGSFVSGDSILQGDGLSRNVRSNRNVCPVDFSSSFQLAMELTMDESDMSMSQ